MTILGGVTVALKVAFDDDPYDTTPTWTDIAADVAWCTVDRGRNAYTAQYQTGTLRALIRDPNGYFDPDNVSSPYYGKLTSDKRIQLTCGGVNRFTGWTASWAPGEVVDGKPTVELTAFDGLWLLARTRMEGVGYREKVLNWSPAPTVYYRLGALDTGTKAYDETGNGRHGVYTKSWKVEAEGLLTADNNGATDFIQFETNISTPTAWGLSGSAGLGFAFIYKPLAFGLQWTLATTLGGVPQTYVLQEADGRLSLYAVGATGTTTIAMDLDGPNFIAVRRAANGTSWQVTLVTASGLSETVSVTAAAGTFAHPLIFSGNGVMDEIVIWSSSDPSSVVGYGVHNLSLSAFKPGYADFGQARFADLLTIAGIPAAFYSNPTGNGPYYPATGFLAYSGVPGSTVLDAARTLAESETSQIFADQDGVITRQPYSFPLLSPTAAVRFDDLAGSNPQYEVRGVIRGEQDRRNRSVVSDGGRSAVVIDTPSQIAMDDQVSTFPAFFADHLADLGLRRLRQLLDPSSRMEPVGVELLSLDATQRAAVLGLELTDVIEVVRSGRTINGRIVRLTDSITPGGYTIRHSTEPYPRSYVATSRATSPKDTNATSSLAVVTLGGQEWDTDGMYPTRQVADPSQTGRTTYLHNGKVHLAVANAEWQGSIVGIDQLELISGASPWPAIAKAINGVGGGAAVIQHFGTLWKANGVDGVELQARTTGSQDVVASTVSGAPENIYSPSLSIVRIPDASITARVKKTTSQSISTGSSLTAVTYNDEDFDDSGLHSTAGNTSRLTLTRAGTWFVGCNFGYQANATGSRTAAITDGTTTLGQSTERSAGASDRAYVQATTLYRLASGYFESATSQDSGSTLTVDVVSSATPTFWLAEMQKPYVRVTNSVAYDGAGGNPAQVANNSDRLCTFNTERDDDVDEHSTSTNTGRLTAASSRWRLIWGNVRFAANATGERLVWIVLTRSGETIGRVIAKKSVAAAASGTTSVQIWTPWYLETGDYVELWVRQSSGGALTLEKANNLSPEFAMACLDPADYDPTLPNELPGLEGWWAADFVDQADNTAVSSWADRSGKGRHLVQGTAANQPTLQTNEMNGLPVVRFDGSNDYMQVAFGSTISQPTTVFIVYKTNSAGTRQIAIDGNDPAARQVVYIDAGFFIGYAAGAGTLLPAASDTSAHIHCVTFNGTSSKYRLDGGAGASGNPGSHGLTGITLGAELDATDSLNGDIAEVIVYSGALSVANINEIGRYLAVKWNIGWVKAT